jgi:hypothetical protein
MLAEYTKENPKIITKCSHHFHLGCIYEWMERSDNCPVCGKVIYLYYFRTSLPEYKVSVKSKNWLVAYIKIELHS